MRAVGEGEVIEINCSVDPDIFIVTRAYYLLQCQNISPVRDIKFRKTPFIIMMYRKPWRTICVSLQTLILISC